MFPFRVSFGYLTFFTIGGFHNLSRMDFFAPICADVIRVVVRGKEMPIAGPGVTARAIAVADLMSKVGWSCGCVMEELTVRRSRELCYTYLSMKTRP